MYESWSIIIRILQSIDSSDNSTQLLLTCKEIPTYLFPYLETCIRMSQPN